MKIPFNKTKIICTIGPSSCGNRVLKKLILEGMDVARFNLSHSTPLEHLKVIRMLRGIASGLKAPLGIMVDLPGVKLRTGEIDGQMVLNENSLVRLEYGRVQKKKQTVPVPSRLLFRELKRKDTVYLDDGKIEMRVVKKSSGGCLCRVLNSGTLVSRKSIHIKGKAPDIPAPTPSDLGYARFFAKNKVDFICLSYVKDKKEIQTLKKVVEKIHPRCFIIAKIETPQAVRNLNKILDVSQGVMVARGDLGLQVDITRIGALQKEIVLKAKEHFLPAIVATQILESMTTGLFPHRSEVTDVTNAILDGADALLLSNETSVGRFPEKAVSVLRRISHFTEDYERFPLRGQQAVPRKGSYVDAVSEAFNFLAANTGSKKVVVATDDAGLISKISTVHCRQDIIVLSGDKKIINAVNMFYRVMPFYLPGKPSMDAIGKFVRKHALRSKKEIIPVLLSREANYTIGIIS